MTDTSLINLNQNQNFCNEDFFYSFEDKCDKNVNINPLLNVPKIPYTFNSNYYDAVTLEKYLLQGRDSILASLNVQSLHSKFSALNEFLAGLDRNLNQSHIKVLALQEIWRLKYPNMLKINGYNLVYKERGSIKGGGVGFYVHSSLRYKVIENLTVICPKIFECITIEVMTNNGTEAYSSIYRSPTGDKADFGEFLNYLDKHLSSLANQYQKSYVCLDSNINIMKMGMHNPLFEYYVTINKNGFYQCINRATRIQSSSISLIDHILTNSQKEHIQSGVIITDISDHFMTFLKLPKGKDQPVVREIKKRNTSMENVQLFRYHLQTVNWDEVYSSKDVNISYNAFWVKFKMLYDQCFPLENKKFNKNIHKIKTFMTRGLLKSRVTKLMLHKKALLDPSKINILNYKNYRNIFNKVIQESKKLYYVKGLEKARKNPKETWCLIKEALSMQKDNNKISQLKVNGSIIQDSLDMANEFNQFFTGIGKKIADSIPQTLYKMEDYLPKINPSDMIMYNVSVETLIKLTKTLPSKTSTDINELSMSFMKNIIAEIANPLTYIFNLSLNTGIVPSMLKKSRIVPIYKAGDADMCDNYRPISLLNSISKILEKIVSVWLVSHLAQNNILHLNQFGFQIGKNTEHNLLKVLNCIVDSLNKNEYCIGIFLDLKKAFDVCDHTILLKKMYHYGIRGTSLDWFRSYLTDRTQVVDINGVQSGERDIDISVMQGSILGPTLFLIYINDLPNVSNMNTFMFADDTQGLLSGKNLDELIDKTNTELKKWAGWFKANRMVVNTSKTKYIIFHNKGMQAKTVKDILFDNNEPGVIPNPALISKIERISINNVNENERYYRLLGVHFDEHLSFNYHINKLTSTLSKTLFFIYKVKNILPQKALVTIYNSLFHAHLLYCPLIVGCATMTNLNKIVRLQKKAIRIVTNSKFNEHTAPIFKKLKVLPYMSMIKLNKLKFMHSIYYNYAPRTFIGEWKLNEERRVPYDLRSSTLFNIQRVFHSKFERFPLICLPKTWNELGDLCKIKKRTYFLKQIIKTISA